MERAGRTGLECAAVVMLLLWGSTASHGEDLKPPTPPMFKPQDNVRPLQQCSIKGIKEVSSTASTARLAVQYYLPDSLDGVFHLGASIPNHGSPDPRFGHKAPLAGVGIPKGERTFTDDVYLDLSYRGTDSVSTSTIGIAIWSSEKRWCTATFNWSHSWGPAAG